MTPEKLCPPNNDSRYVNLYYPGVQVPTCVESPSSPYVAARNEKVFLKTVLILALQKTFFPL
ncbi:hypothetical protein Avbf_14158 [Armadillidium vulgare]|nr:hypothetical protein Avbf_14158 [Armadillidium vulgare]